MYNRNGNPMKEAAMAELKIDIPHDKVVEFCQRYRIRRLSLFGSILREDFRPDSDVDVLVEFDPEAKVGFVALSRMQRELSAILQRQVDIVPRSGLKPLIRDSVMADEEVIYAS